MAEQSPPRNDGDDLLKRADALLSRHRSTTKPATAEVPVLSEATKPAPASVPASADDDIPTLTEVIPAELLPAARQHQWLIALGPGAHQH